VLGFVEVLRRSLGVEELPDFRTMIVVSVLALIAYSVCLYMLQRPKTREAHMQASVIFTSNDVIVNLGVITAGVLWLGSGIPDLAIGAVAFVVVTLGAVRILRLLGDGNQIKGL
jgi:Co/Zn/Cd efflux system component